LKSLNPKHFWLLFFFSAVWVASLPFAGRFLRPEKTQQIEFTNVYPEQRFLRGEKLDLNRATLRELMALPGVGAALAGEIIRNRTARGPFPTVEALGRVRGIGPKKLDRIRPLVVVSGGRGR
jgi:competence ComEA-like helix-hairpin-helix protein